MDVLYIAVITCFMAVMIFLYGILVAINWRKISIEKRIKEIAKLYSSEQENNEEKSFSDRILKPLYSILSQLLLKATPNHKLTLLTKKLERAGILKHSTKEKWLYVKTMITLIVSFLAGFLHYTIAPSIPKALFLAILVGLLVSTAFNFYLSKRIEERKKKILKDLPYTLDLITVSVEAGLSFDGAMSRVVMNIKGELSDEFSKGLKEIRMGIERKIALRNMGERCDVKELSAFITSIVQADELGVSLGRVLRIEAADLRERRKQIAREKAMKAPIKMLFPLIFFIFPSIFIIILGPAVIGMIEVFSR